MSCDFATVKLFKYHGGEERERERETKERELWMPPGKRFADFASAGQYEYALNAIKLLEEPLPMKNGRWQKKALCKEEEKLMIDFLRGKVIHTAQDLASMVSTAETLATNNMIKKIKGNNVDFLEERAEWTAFFYSVRDFFIAINGAYTTEEEDHLLDLLTTKYKDAYLQGRKDFSFGRFKNRPMWSGLTYDFNVRFPDRMRNLDVIRIKSKRLLLRLGMSKEAIPSWKVRVDSEAAARNKAAGRTMEPTTPLSETSRKTSPRKRSSRTLSEDQQEKEDDDDDDDDDQQEDCEQDKTPKKQKSSPGPQESETFESEDEQPQPSEEHLGEYNAFLALIELSSASNLGTSDAPENTGALLKCT